MYTVEGVSVSPDGICPPRHPTDQLHDPQLQCTPEDTILCHPLASPDVPQGQQQEPGPLRAALEDGPIGSGESESACPIG